MRGCAVLTAALALCLAAGASAQTYTVLHEFAGAPADGASPQGGLVADGNKCYGMAAEGGQYNGGVLFSVNTDGGGYTILHEFGNPPDGVHPLRGLALDGGVLYGATRHGGAPNRGTVFSMRTDGTGYTVLYSFLGTPDGYDPEAPVLAAAGVLYGLTNGGGTTDDGTAFSMVTDGTGYTIIHNFANQPADGDEPTGGLLLDNGTLYGATSGGGRYIMDAGTVFSMAPDGSNPTLLHSFSVTDGADPVGGLISDGSRLYGATRYGGEGGIVLYYGYGGGTIFAVAPDGSNFQTLHHFEGPDGMLPRSSLARDGERLYGTTLAGGAAVQSSNGPFPFPGGGTLFSLNTDGTGFTVLRSFDGLIFGTGSFLEGTPLIVNGTIYGAAMAGGAQGKGVLFSYAIPTPALMVTLNTIFPAAGQAFTIDAALQPLAQRFDAWAVIQAPDGAYFSMVLGQPNRLVPGGVPLALNVPGIAVLEQQLLSMTLPAGLAPGAYTITVALLPAGAPPALENAIPGYGVQRIATIR